MKVYISGQISGLSQDEYTHHFGLAEAKLLSENHEPVNPLKVVPCETEDCAPSESRKEDGTFLHAYHCYMKHDFRALLECDAICMLPNAGNSKGAIAELNVAMMCGFAVMYVDKVTGDIFS